MAGLAFLAAFLCCVAIIPFIRKWAIEKGHVSFPRNDRWHRLPTPIFGGIGIVIAFFISIFFYCAFAKYILGIPDYDVPLTVTGLFLGAIMIFLVGLLDDIRQLKPGIKLIGQIAATLIVIAAGIRTDFFTPRIAAEQFSVVLNVLLSIGWIVGITNTINLIDNMDGVAAGISLIASLALSYLFWQGGAEVPLIISLSLCGSLLGFLIYNFPPASIFMGDSGSQFIGFTLASLAIIRQPQASNLVAIIGVPALLFILPIIDTALVTYTRILRGSSPLDGGRDHTTHRLIAFGLNERQVLIILYSVAIVAGIAAISIERIAYWLSLIYIPLILIGLALLAAYLGGLKIFVGPTTGTENNSALVRLINTLTYKRRLLELILDVFLVGISYYLAYIFVYGVENMLQIPEIFIQSLPAIIMLSIFALFVFGVYRSIWQFISLNDILRYFIAVAVIVLLASILLPLLFGTGIFSIGLFILYGIFLFILLGATRASFRILNLASSKLTIGNHKTANLIRENSFPSDLGSAGVIRENILIIGADTNGENVLRWIQINPQLGLFPVGFISLDKSLVNRRIRGVRILSSIEEIDTVIFNYKINGIILPQSYIHNIKELNLVNICEENNCWIKELVFEFKDIRDQQKS